MACSTNHPKNCEASKMAVKICRSNIIQVKGCQYTLKCKVTKLFIVEVMVREEIIEIMWTLFLISWIKRWCSIYERKNVNENIPLISEFLLKSVNTIRAHFFTEHCLNQLFVIILKKECIC